MKYELREAIAETERDLIERIKAKCPNLSDEALEILSSGIVQRAIENKLLTEEQKKQRLWEIVKEI